MPLLDRYEAQDADHRDVVLELPQLVLLAVKARDTAAALEVVAPALDPDGCVVSLQNGLEEYRIADAVGAARTIGAALTFGGHYVEPGVVHYGGPGSLHLGELDGAITDRVQGLSPPVVETARVALAVGVEPAIVDGFDPLAFVANDRAGIEASWDAQRRYWGSLDATRTGVWRDLNIHQRPTEVREILGPVLQRAHACRCAAPELERLFAAVQAAEAAITRST